MREAIQRLLICWIIVAALSCPLRVWGATNRYMAPSGCSDSGACTSSSSPCCTFSYVFTKMSGGDTLYLADGTYTSQNYNNLINQFNLPPNGSPGAYTTITATNIPCQGSVPCNQPLSVIFQSGAGINSDGYPTAAYLATNGNYVKVRGIMFEDGCGLIGSSVNGWPSHWYFKQCAAEGQSDGNTAVFGFGAKYIVLEDCVAYGKGRYKYLFYDYDQNGTVFNDVCRRCFARMDWDGCRGSCPMDSFCSYAPTNMAFLNCIDIDGNTPTDWTSDEVAGSFAEQHLDLSNQNLLFQGCIAINTGQPLAFTQHSGESGVSFVDVVGVHLGGGFFGGGASFLRTTLLDVTSANFTYSSTGVSDMTSANTGFEYYSNGSPAQT